LGSSSWLSIAHAQEQASLGGGGLLRVPAVADRRVRVRVLAAGWRPRRVAGWLEDIEIALTPNLILSNRKPCVRARSREQQGGEGVPGFAAVSARIGEEANGHFLCHGPQRSAGGAQRTPWPARPKASSCPPSLYVHASSGGVGNAFAGAGIGEVAASELRLFRRETIQRLREKGS
jgi:hypothetical protein